MIERQKIVAPIKRQPRQIRHVPPQNFLREVMQDATRRADGRLPGSFSPEPVQRRHLEMFAHRKHRCLRAKNPIIVTIDDPAEARGHPAMAARFKGF